MLKNLNGGNIKNIVLFRISCRELNKNINMHVLVHVRTFRRSGNGGQEFLVPQL